MTWLAFALLVLGALVSQSAAALLVRKNVEDLTQEEVLSLQSYLSKLEADESEYGFQKLAAYHGEPSMCQSDDGTARACCIHGMANFPQWHRLYVVQFEQLLRKKGMSMGVPYWDTVGELTSLPDLVEEHIFRDPNGGRGKENAWFSANIKHGNVDTKTARAVDKRLFQKVGDGEKTQLFNLILDALEKDDYCQFEVQFEVAHNHIHYLVGGRHKYSMSTLEYSSYDPIFFLHHSAMDRIFVIWQELQKKRGKSSDHADCSVELFRWNLWPFDRSSNPVELTKQHSKADSVWHHPELGYWYDTLTLGGMDLDQLHAYLEKRRARERAYATFSLHGVGYSANARVQVCGLSSEHPRDTRRRRDASDNCEFAGDFFLLGGANEMPWEFHLPYYFDVTEAVQRLGVALDGAWTVKVDFYHVNGTAMPGDILPPPVGAHRPAKGAHDSDDIHGHSGPDIVVRKDVSELTAEEMYELRQAMSKFQNDTSVDGYQAVAEFHGLPARCPRPDAAVRYACCIHGMATFPHWHRLFVVQIEDELRARGLHIGVPYWDWTRPNTHIPKLAAEATYQDPHHEGVTLNNPFYEAAVAFLGKKTERDVQSQLSENPPFGDHTDLFDGMLLAFEQTDFCDFEIQFEVTHNAPHFLVGGFKPYSLATLHYSAFDPIFYLHHSNVDRLWAIWQELQLRRGLPYEAHCANSMTHDLLKPFGFEAPLNNNEKTHSHARPTKIYDYELELDYTYDNLQFGGMTIEQLEHYLEERQARERVFVGLEFHNIGVSAWADVYVVAGGQRYRAGGVAVLGGEQEMPWHFDRLFKMEITDALKALGLGYNDDFTISLNITDVNGKHVDENTFSHDTIFHDPPHVHHDAGDAPSPDKVRSNIESLTREQVQNLRDALQALEDDSSNAGFAQIAAFHGEPRWCPSTDAEKKYACCLHGMAVFPHWHRLITVQAENALRAHGFEDGLPYWDWTRPMKALPQVVESAQYVNQQTGQTMDNPFHHGIANGHATERDVSPKLFQQPEFGKFTDIAELVMFAFEQTDFCDFEVQMEIAHNYIHALVGGSKPYSMSSLRYTTYDPIFFLHHSNTDRIWAIWQALQKYRGLPYNTANCALASMRKPLQPFAQTSVVNPDPMTRDHSVPFEIFDYQSSFHYTYDDLEFNGLSIPQLQHEVVVRQAHERVFAGFMLKGIGQSALVTFEICQGSGQCSAAGEFYMLGDEYEMPWVYDRLFKYEITQQLADKGLKPLDSYYVQYQVKDLQNNVIGTDNFGKVTIVHTYGAGHLDRKSYGQELKASSHVRQNVDSLSEGQKESLKAALQKMESDGSFEKIAEFHGAPGLCKHEGRNVGCCIHGMATFPHWHRLYVEQVENALLTHGSEVSIPYWDWTSPIKELPDLVSKATYFDSRSQTMETNPFFKAQIGNTGHYTTRDPQPQLFNTKYFLNNVLLALEQTSFCDFEAQFEVVHNMMHSFVGGRGKYSLSTLDYSAYDPLFFIYHANTDRIWAIWQALQSQRGLPWDESDCALNHMHDHLHPFDDKAQNEFDITHKYNHPDDVWDYSDHLDYHYDTLELNGWSIAELEEVLEKQRSRDRMFAGFMLHDIGTSADVEIFICLAAGKNQRDCNHPAGKFSVLGGEFEMPFAFDRQYKFDISEALTKLGIRLGSNADFDLKVTVQSYNGSYLSSDLLDAPTIIFSPGNRKVQSDRPAAADGDLVRRNVWSLSFQERRSLVLALRSLQEDHSADGFQSLASFHAVPELCPYPEAPKRFACCVHGSPAFPHWHRLYTVQFEEALKRHGSLVGLPYWDTTDAQSFIPNFLTDEKFHDTVDDVDIPNPWLGADIEFENSHTERQFNMDKLRKEGPKGYDTWSWEQVMLAFEQENFCDFEVQFEVMHNAIHAWTGGTSVHSMAHLHYASYDPIFMLHHSSTDRIFAIWQELQRLRGLDPNSANCDLETMHAPLKPFSFGSPYNLNPDTKRYSSPDDIFDYHGHFHYEYDDLEMQGLSPPQILDRIAQRKERERVFAGFLLHGIGTSAHVEFSVCKDNACTPAGDFNVLGGYAEMPWSFDRAYKYEITDVLKKKNIDPRDQFTIELKITALNGTTLSGNAFGEPSIIIQARSAERGQYNQPANRIRHDLTHLSERDFMSLKSALNDLQADTGKMGWQSLASFHGVPALCPTPAEATYACCIHGMPTFPHWHRLYTLLVEHALIEHGSSSAIPYWDWTQPLDGLPALFTEQTYYDAWKDKVFDNPFARGYIKSVDGYTVRDPQSQMSMRSKDGKHSILFDRVLDALEQDDFCDFEVQFEVTHNAIHYLVGGPQTYSLSSLHYSSYDPIFFVHHSFVDKIWAVWQELQRRRGKPYDRADCAVNYMSKPMMPFNSPDLDPDLEVRAHAVPNSVFNYFELGYKYDNLEIGGESLEQLEDRIRDQQSHARVFAGFYLGGIGTSAGVTFAVCRKDDGKRCTYGGSFFILGGSKEMPWSFDRVYKHDMTRALHAIGLEPEDVFDYKNYNVFISYNVTAVNNTALPRSIIPKPTILYEPAKVPANRVRKDLTDLSAEDVNSLKSALAEVQADRGKLGWQSLASYHGVPALCPTPEAAAYACCVHGMPTFPHWHRLYTLEVDRALIHHGSRVAIPYWDWTLPIKELPAILTAKTFHDPDTDADVPNPFARAYIAEANTYIRRDPQPELKRVTKDGEHNVLFDEVLLALEQDDFCDFEIQFEVTHNAVHYLVGGHDEHSLASLHYSSYDPAFFLHHSFVDKIWAVWEELQKKRHKPYVSADCVAAKYLNEPLHPFDDPDLDPDDYVRTHAMPSDSFDYHNLGYDYDDMKIGGKSLDQLADIIKEHQSHSRAFAGFHLEGIGASADVEFEVCRGGQCQKAGTFFLLGGAKEMPWSFDRLYKFDITDPLHALGIEPEDAILSPAPFTFKIQVFALNGSSLPSSTLDAPKVLYAPAANRMRRSVDDLSNAETTSLREAFLKMRYDTGPLGSQALASYHGLPAMCPTPAEATYACCIHGMPTFPHWHRLYTLEVDRSLVSHGSSVAVPYWDWTLPVKKLPALIDDATYFNDNSGKQEENPFNWGYIMEAKTKTVRDPQPELFKVSKDGQHSVLFDEVLLALEQDDYCDFEIQFEVTHNALHYLIGGRNLYSLSSLHYSSYDPAFFMHHSFIDKIWVVWQKLQKRRGKEYQTAKCAAKYMSEALHPFDDPELDPDELVRTHAMPDDVFNNMALGYKYDNLEIGGKNLDELEAIIKEHQSHSRVFAGFHLEGFQTSADVVINVCRDDTCARAGAFFVLGGSKEMPWSFDRQFKYEITDALAELNIEPADVTDVKRPPFSFKLDIHAINGSALSSSVLDAPTVIVQSAYVPDERVRHDLNHMSAKDLVSLRNALRELNDDTGVLGFQSLASFHGVPAMCPTPAAAQYACCIHGMPTFPHWHRLYTLEVERALIWHGSKVSMPYWDWTLPVSELPSLATEQSYYDPKSETRYENPFSRAYIGEARAYTVRDVRPELTKVTKNGANHVLFDEVMLALEQEDYCDFEIQFEVTHNAMHYVVGGHQLHSLASLHYSSYDPIFFLHHSFVDKIWVVWQELQKRRHKPYNTAECAAKYLAEPLHPFDDPDLDPDDVVRTHAMPNDVFDINELGYKYDNFEIGGKDLNQLEAIIKQRRSHDRAFAGWRLKGIKTSADVLFNVCTKNQQGSENCVRGGKFILLGGEKEMPWAFDRPYLYEITEQLGELGIPVEEASKTSPSFYFTWEVEGIDGSHLPASSLSPPTAVFKAGYDFPSERVRHELSDLSESDLRSLKTALVDLQEDEGKLGWQSLAAYHGVPALCPTPEAATYACCVHGMPTFPHWHRLYTLEVDRALLRHGSKVAIPYWDWTLPVTELPSILTSKTFFNDDHGRMESNPFAKSYISESSSYIQRDPQPELFKKSKDGKHSVLFDEVLYALEQQDYCDFEVQFEVTHNAFHYMLGGFNEHSLSSLHYSSYDPAFFLHHSFVDKIWAVWQKLQKKRGRPYNTAQCAADYMDEPLHPFDDPVLDPDELVRSHALPTDVFDYHDLGYTYDDLSIGGLSPSQLADLIAKEEGHDRVFAGFQLAGIGTSAKVEFDVCAGAGDSNCRRAGAFFLLGGSKEMPWSFDRPYRYEITDILDELHIEPEDATDKVPPFHFRTRITALNGSALSSDILGTPKIIFVGVHVPHDRVRHDLSRVSESDLRSLKSALGELLEDDGKMGWQALASYHGVPALCPTPEAATYACCIHGMPTFPHWHRLYTLEVDHALYRHGSKLSIPYWDWTLPMDKLPSILTADTYYNENHAKREANPFLGAYINESHQYIVRDPQPALWKVSGDGEHSVLFEEVLYALEQDDFCDFEVQFEVTHNALHYLVGGRHLYSLSSLHYSSYDPAFFLHHSFVDKIWAVWQELQKRRGKAYNRADCAARFMGEPLHPFDDPDLDPDEEIRTHAMPNDVFDIHELGYSYDNLDIGGHSIEELERHIANHQNHDRVFAGFRLSGIKTSADVEFFVCKGPDTTGAKSDENCVRGGGFFLLGGEKEMPWSFDRLYKYEITDQVRELGINPSDAAGEDPGFHLHVTAHDINGDEVPASALAKPEVVFDAAHLAPVPRDRVRYELSSVSESDLSSLKAALGELQHDDGKLGWQSLASYHGVPALCPTPEAATYACCVHGMPTFPHWHRLYTLEVDHALFRHGAKVSIPYWDWTQRMDRLPSILTRASFFNEESGQSEPNPFLKAYINESHQYTVRTPQSALWKVSSDGQHSVLFDEVLYALEQDDFCDFEVQFEVTHNAIHYLVGGRNLYSLSSLHYSSYDPAFFLHHSFVDKIWAVWQELQRRRGKPYNTADCAGKYLNEPLHPFDDPDLDPDEDVRAHAMPSDVFDYRGELGYYYDNFNIGGKSINQLEALIRQHRGHDRAFAEFSLSGQKTSADVEFFVCKNDNCVRGGGFFLLGGEKEMPWSFDRPYKYEITDQLKELGIEANEATIRVNVHDVSGAELSASVVGTPRITVDPAH
uniref:Mega-hemocyanin n=1 Tax=Melanoides tuberculata TaxID=55729 RepID=V5KRT6_MELTU|nr:mega-hemocyanin [Melanoides tuberculata]